MTREYIFTSPSFYISIVAVIFLYLKTIKIIENIVHHREYKKEIVVSIILLIYICISIFTQIWDSSTYSF